MKSNCFILILTLFLCVLISGCDVRDEVNQKTDLDVQKDAPKPSTNTEEPKEVGDLNLKLQIGSEHFEIALFDNDTVKELMTRLPMSFTMDEMNGNEKYYYMPSPLPHNAQSISSIQAGDVMLFGDDCLVIFYESFTTNYQYTPIGHIDDSERLLEVLGSDDVEVTLLNEVN